jgi:hypothetical protein
MWTRTGVMSFHDEYVREGDVLPLFLMMCDKFFTLP